MPVEKKLTQGQVTFALAIVKSSVVSNHSESSRIRAALQLMFPEVSFILVAEDDDIFEIHRTRSDLTAFAKQSLLCAKRACASAE